MLRLRTGIFCSLFRQLVERAHTKLGRGGVACFACLDLSRRRMAENLRRKSFPGGGGANLRHSLSAHLARCCTHLMDATQPRSPIRWQPRLCAVYDTSIHLPRQEPVNTPPRGAWSFGSLFTEPSVCKIRNISTIMSGGLTAQIYCWFVCRFWPNLTRHCFVLGKLAPQKAYRLSEASALNDLLAPVVNSDVNKDWAQKHRDNGREQGLDPKSLRICKLQQMCLLNSIYTWRSVVRPVVTPIAKCICAALQITGRTVQKGDNKRNAELQLKALVAWRTWLKLLSLQM